MAFMHLVNMLVRQRTFNNEQKSWHIEQQKLYHEWGPVYLIFSENTIIFSTESGVAECPLENTKGIDMIQLC